MKTAAGIILILHFVALVIAAIKTYKVKKNNKALFQNYKSELFFNLLASAVYTAAVAILIF